MRQAEQPQTVDAIRRALRGKTGRVFWRCLDELADTAAFRGFLDAEFPDVFPAASRIDRRRMLKVMGASLALAGLTGCGGEADEAALPYAEAPEFVVPGNPKWYATAVTLGGYALPVLGKTHVGRPVKLEGNPDHPVTQGATDPFLQASLLGLYDPDRTDAPRHLGSPTSWNAVDGAMAAQALELERRKGEGFRLLTGAVTSPTLVRQVTALMQRWPNARWHVLEPVNDDLWLEATKRVFGRPLARQLMLDQAEAVISFDDDVLGPGPSQAVYARRWSARRQAYQTGRGECRWFVAEPAMSSTGAMAQERLPVAPERLSPLAQAVATALGIEEAARPELSEAETRWVDSVVGALRARQGRTLVVAGVHQSPDLQALCLLINEHIGSFGDTLRFTEPVVVAPPDGARSCEVLAQDMAAGRVSMLACLGANPAYATPGDLEFSRLMAKVPVRLHAGLHYDETAALSHWHVPLAHDLESWSDARAIDGTVSIIQPLIRPFRAVRSIHVLLENLGGALNVSDRDTIQHTCRIAWTDQFDERWRQALVRGFVADSAASIETPVVVNRSHPPPVEMPAGNPAVIIRPDPTVWDGRFANNAWLQETPKPLTKVTWSNVIAVSPQLASERNFTNGDEVRVDIGGRSVTGPLWIVPGQAHRTVAVTLGYGRTHAGHVGNGLGYNAFVLQSKTARWQFAAALTPTGKKLIVANTQMHQAMDGLDLVRTVPRPDLPNQPENPKAQGLENSPSFYPALPSSSPSWGMAIDLDTCIGCNACLVACVAENNVPMVGKELVAQGREMHWLRIDHYHEGDSAAPKTYFQPVPCMHCELAPCEMGCPVNAAVHSTDGLNLQVYNRCIGTRTCSSFCPYKVRRFNWFNYTGDDPESIRAMRNPDVTVRERGVMEKCTYCVQRISAARIAAKIDGRPIRDGEVITACQQACPTQAITFGDVKDAESAVSRRKAGPRNYSLLEEANTRPRTTYLARIEEPAADRQGGSK